MTKKDLLKLIEKIEKEEVSLEDLKAKLQSNGMPKHAIEVNSNSNLVDYLKDCYVTMWHGKIIAMPKKVGQSELKLYYRKTTP